MSTAGDEDREAAHSMVCALEPAHAWRDCPDIGFDADGMFYRH